MLEFLGWTMVGLAIGLFLFWRLWFLRLPKRTIPAKGIVSPASGTVIKIMQFKDGKAADIPKGMLGQVKAVTSDVAKEGWIVVIMLTPMDVHYQRSPIEGSVSSLSYTKGLFRNAVINGTHRLFENERNSILFRTTQGNIKVIQVAGVAARRIECFVKPKQKVGKGDVIGLINLGSQVILVLPKLKLKVREGQYLTDGETVIA